MALPDKVKQAWQTLADQMIADMDRDGLMWVRDWASPEPPCNGVTGEPYRGRNMLLLMAAIRIHGFTDPRFMTFNTAKRAGYSVRKGEKSCAVIEKWKPIAFSKSDPDKRIKQPKTEEEWAEARENPDIEVAVRCVGYFNVFNAAQIDGIEPYVAQARRADCLDDDAITTLERMSPCPVRELPQDRAYYSPRDDEITMPTRSQFSTFGGFARTLLHEQGHATGAPSRLDRDLGGRFGTDKYAREELAAELSSMFSAQALGIRFDDVEEGEFTQSEYWKNHAAYLKGWSQRFDDPASEIRAVVPKAIAASDLIVNRYRSEGILDTWSQIKYETVIDPYGPAAFPLIPVMPERPEPISLAESAAAVAKRMGTGAAFPSRDRAQTNRTQGPQDVSEDNLTAKRHVRHTR